MASDIDEHEDDMYIKLLSFMDSFWHIAAMFVVIPMAVTAAIHAALCKRESRAALGWIGIIFFVPFVGSLLYFLFGINRIQRRATALFGDRIRFSSPQPISPLTADGLRDLLPIHVRHLESLYRIVQQISRRALFPGNQITTLYNGDQAYPEMLNAISQAQHSITLTTYIFDDDRVGSAFCKALKQAVQRGVQVRVLIDAVGGRYSWPPIYYKMRRDGITVDRFMPTRLPWRWAYMNLRSHRKILVVDGKLGFTGGMNIREGHQLSLAPRHPVQDIHFRVEGPVVHHLQEVFCEDWHFTTDEWLEGPEWFPHIESVGNMACRGISDGPDDDFEHIRWTILGAIASAQHSIRIITPYFLPDSSIINALNIAAMRGVDVEILLPSKNNLSLVQWASTAHYSLLLERGCRLYASAPPFDHTKLMIVDQAWSFIGSTNWDPRSLRLNFEFNLECYDTTLADVLYRLFVEKITNAQPISLDSLRERSWLVRIRDGFARLLTPYL
jgi:cardiolipin synthase